MTTHENEPGGHVRQAKSAHSRAVRRHEHAVKQHEHAVRQHEQAADLHRQAADLQEEHAAEMHERDGTLAWSVPRDSPTVSANLRRRSRTARTRSGIEAVLRQRAPAPRNITEATEGRSVDAVRTTSTRLRAATRCWNGIPGVGGTGLEPVTPSLSS